MRMRQASPAWTHTPKHDPGITLLELLAYLGDVLSYYQDRVAKEERLRTRRFVSSSLALGAVLFLWWRCRANEAEPRA
jgi:hypothetical protein